MAKKGLYTKQEEQYGGIFHNLSYEEASKLTDKKAKELFENLETPETPEFTGVSFDDRIKFLEDNGYEVSRENFTTDLSARPKEEDAI